MELPRRILQRYTAELTGHGDFADYHRRFGHDPTKCRPCRCGAERARLHFAVCPAVGERSPASTLLNNPKVFWNFVKKYRPYE